MPWYYQGMAHDDDLISPEYYSQAQEDLAAVLEGARQDPAIFAEYVIRDEGSGRPIQLSGLHRAWHDMITDNDRVLIWSSVESGKTQQLSVARVLWELGKDPTLRFAIVSNTYEQGCKILRAIIRYIEQSEELHQVFPLLKKGELWSGSQIIVERPTTSKDPSIQVCGVHGNITGARVDRLVIDDILDYENCRTEWLRRDLWDWFHATLSGRLTARARVWCVGTAYHPDDLMHRLAKVLGWKSARYPILDPHTGESSWPDRWSFDRIERRRQEIGPLEFARQMLCQARDDSDSRFKREWIELCMARGRGPGRSIFPPRLDIMPSGFKTFTGVDLAVSRKDSADKTALFTIGVHPNGTREVLHVESGRWAGPEIIGRIVDINHRYHSIMIVENNAAQDFLIQFTRQQHAIPIRPFTTTGKNKNNPEFGVESIAAEMAGGKWIIPCEESGHVNPEVAAWITEMLYYDPAGHTGDHLIASWFAREGARQFSRRVETGRLNLMRR
jgi:hypothetical protein